MKNKDILNRLLKTAPTGNPNVDSDKKAKRNSLGGIENKNVSWHPTAESDFYDVFV